MKRRQVPRATDRMADQDGRLIEPWRTYLADLPNKMTTQDDLGVSPTNGQIATAFNALLTKLKAAGLMEE